MCRSPRWNPLLNCLRNRPVEPDTEAVGGTQNAAASLDSQVPFDVMVWVSFMSQPTEEEEEADEDEDEYEAEAADR